MFIKIAAFCIALFAGSATAFVLPWTIEKRVAAASVIAVIKVKEPDRYHEGGSPAFSEAIVVEGILGAKTGELVKVWDETFFDEEGKEYTISGRDPYLEQGKTYFIYLRKDQQGRLITVQSSLDSLDVVGDQVEKEGEEGFESLVDKIMRTRELIAELKKAQQGGAGRPATRPESDSKSGDKPQPESEGRSR